MKLRKFLPVFFLLNSLSLFCIDFSHLNLASDDRLLFKAEFASQNAVFISSLETNSIRQLTAFPEKLQLVDNGRSVLVTNRFGITRIPTAGGLPSPVPGFPSISEGRMPLKGRLQEAAASNDGRWIVYIEPVSPAYGTLFIINTATGEKRIITERIELPARDYPVKWSPDSRLFVYAKNNNLYYFPILSDLSVQIDERFRLIGAGSINSITWGQQGDFYFFSGNTLYRVRNPELFTRTVYGDFLSIGNAVVTIPFEFDPNFDRYWTAPDSSSILISKNEKGIFLFLTGERNAGNISLLHISIPSGAENFNVLWPSRDHVKIFYTADSIVNTVYFDINEDIRSSYQFYAVPLSANGVLSPDGTKAAFWGEHGLELWDFKNWRLLQRLFSEQVFSCAWLNNERLIAGNSRFITEVNISGETAVQRRICLSGAAEIGFEEIIRGQSRVLARIGSEWYATDTRNGWLLVNAPAIRPVTSSTERYRVYLESNNIMVRNLQSAGASALLSGQTEHAAFPQRSPFKLALCFDLYDDDAGLYHVLAALTRNNIRATFFLNGEFIRRNPAGARAIAESGHETGSMFYAPIDLADSRYRITRDFIVRGLSRNEDEYFNATGKELGLLWHPPFYRSSDFITSAASSARYVFIPRTLDLQDWVSREESARLNLRQVPPSQMIEQILNQRGNEAVISIRLGLLPGGRDEYLFQRIDVLLDALVRCGVEVVPISAVGR